MAKKKLLVWSNFSRLLTGFGGHKKRVLQWFHQQPDWEVVEAAAGIAYDSPDCHKLPWKCYGLAPTPQQQAQIQSIQDEGQRSSAQRDANYGALNLDEVIKAEKPDYFLGIEDSWCFDNVINRHWHNVLPSFYNVTIDSLPLMPAQIDMAGKVRVYPWATFAEEAYSQYGYKTPTIPGTVDPDVFSPISPERRKELREKFKLDDSIVFLKVARNQLRKHFPNLLEGFKLFKDRNSGIKAKLHFHTHFGEGWALPQIIQDKGVDPNDVLTTYYCKACREWEVRPFFGLNQDCPHCGSQKSFDTCSIVNGVDDKTIAEIYGISDMTWNLISSGGFEYSSWQAKMCEKIIASPDYSCGYDAVREGSGGWPVKWASYMEPHSNFIKSSADPNSVCELMEKFVALSVEERTALEKQSRKFALEWCSTERVCRRWKEEFEKFPPADWSNFDWTPPRKNPTHQPPPNLSYQDFVIDLFRNVLKEKVDHNNSQVKFWTEHLAKSNDHQGVYSHFTKIATQHNAQLDYKPTDFGDLLDPIDEKRLLIVMPQSAGDVLIVNSLVPRIKKLYPEFSIYFATSPQFRELVEHLPEIHRVLDYVPQMDDIFSMTGRGQHKGWFDVVMPLHAQTQKFFTYQNRRNKFRSEWLL